MSANKFKVGDKVRVRKGLIPDKYYGGVRCASSMAKMDEAVLTIDCVESDYYEVKDCVFGWSDEMLEPAEKALDNLCAGDFIKSDNGIRKILAAVDGCYLLSYIGEYTATGSWCTVDELEESGYSFIEPDTPETTIEIDGKRYDEAEVKKAIKDLKPIE
jgi:hypothetical protein|nr:MAG TPA: Mind bomb SH3 repeat domain [Caudoviricetes sp.]